MSDKHLTTNQGVPVTDNQSSLTVGERGSVLLQDVHLIEKLAHFDRERIPERVVHAKWVGAHGYFQVYQSMAPYTCAKFLQDPETRRRSSFVFQRSSALGGLRTRRATREGLRSSSTLKRENTTSWETTCPSSSSEMLSSFLTWYTPSRPHQIPTFRRPPQQIAVFGILSP